MSERWDAIRPWVGRGARLGLLAAAVAAVVYWVRLSPVAVEAHTVGAGPIAAEVMGTGTLEARVNATISPKIAGRIAEVKVDQGDRVSAGAVLVRLDDEDLQQQVAIAHANLEAARARVDRLTVDRGRASTVLVRATKDHERIRKVATSVSAEELDRVTEAFRVAESGLALAEAAIAEGQKELVAAEKTLEYHRARLADTAVTAPFDGLIVRRHRDPGDVVMPGSPVLSLISTAELWISAWVDETAMAGVQPGQPARVVFRSEPDRPYPGRVARLGREADRETREFVVDVGALELPQNWAVGQRAEVYIETGRRESALLLPARAVVWREGEAGVFIEEGGRAAWRPIRVGMRSEETLEAVGGVQAGEVVVAPADPRDALTVGRRVRLP